MNDHEYNQDNTTWRIESYWGARAQFYLWDQWTGKIILVQCLRCSCHSC